MVSPEYDFLLRLASRARGIALDYFRQDPDVQLKSDRSPVTQADQNIELALRAMIREHYPADAIRGEEYDAQEGTSEFTWVIDPIDGTRSFVAGVPIFGVLVARLHRQGPAWGLMEMPALNETWIGQSGGESSLNGQRLHVGPPRTLQQARVIAHFAGMLELAPTFPGLWVVKRAASHFLGGDCYGFGMVAAGQADICIQSGVAPQDYAALIPIVTAAGGVMTDWQGHALDGRSKSDVVAVSHASLHAEVLECLQAV